MLRCNPEVHNLQNAQSVKPVKSSRAAQPLIETVGRPTQGIEEEARSFHFWGRMLDDC